MDVFVNRGTFMVMRTKENEDVDLGAGLGRSRIAACYTDKRIVGLPILKCGNDEPIASV